MLWLFAALLTKHFIVDFPLQPKWMYANKGKLGHPGGIAHAVFHGWATLMILLVATKIPVFILVLISAAEIWAHYFIDWAKVNINKELGWGPTTHEQFWWFLGFDQWLHQACYIAIVAIIY